MGPWTFAWICCPQLPYHPCKNGTHSTCFYCSGQTVGQPRKGNVDKMSKKCRKNCRKNVQKMSKKLSTKCPKNVEKSADKMSKKCRKNCRKNVQKLSGGAERTIFGHFWGNFCLLGRCFCLVTLSNARPLQCFYSTGGPGLTIAPSIA